MVSLSDVCQWNTTKCRVGVSLTLTNVSYRLGSDESFRPCLDDLKRDQEKSMDLFFVTGFERLRNTQSSHLHLSVCFEEQGI